MRPENVGAPFRRSELFGGRGDVLVWDLLAGRSAAPFTAVLACELEAQGLVGKHLQEAYSEIVICTEGRGIVTVGTQELPFAPGVVVHLPQGDVLSISNDGADPLRYLIIKAQG